MKNKSLILIGALFVAIMVIAVALYPKLSEKANEAIEATTQSIEESSQSTEAATETNYPKYADIKIYDKNGNAVMLSEFEGKPVILNFWAIWCGYCIQEMPDFEAAYKEYGDEIQFLIVNNSDGIEKGENFISDRGYSFPTYYDLDYDASITYSITGIPRTIAIDAKGNIRYNRAGMIDADALHSIIDMIK